MPQLKLKYGRTTIPFEYGEDRFRVLDKNPKSDRLTDADLGEHLDHPIDSATLEEIIEPGESVLVVVPDATRQTACGQVINLVVRRLIANGTAAHDIRIIFATGIHRKVTENEKSAILTPFIAQRIKTLDHDPRDLAQIVRLGHTTGGIPIELNRAVLEHDHVILIGAVTFHYFAGFTGGRKLICPGLASTKTVSETHRLAFDCETKSRRAGVGPGRISGNAVHEAFVEAVANVNPSFCISTIVNESGDAVDLFCGDWAAAHQDACKAYSAGHTIRLREKRDLVVASCGGYPHDINLIQAHKTLDAAARACNRGGIIILLADCEDGLGRNDFLNWFEAADSPALAEMLCEKYQVNGQTAWSLLRIAEDFDVRVITRLPEADLRRMRLEKADFRTLKDENVISAASGYIFTSGSRFAVLE